MGDCGQSVVGPSTLDPLQLHRRSPMGLVLWKQRKMMTVLGQGQGDPGRKDEVMPFFYLYHNDHLREFHLNREQEARNTVDAGKQG